MIEQNQWNRSSNRTESLEIFRIIGIRPRIRVGISRNHKESSLESLTESWNQEKLQLIPNHVDENSELRTPRVFITLMLFACIAIWGENLWH